MSSICPSASVFYGELASTWSLYRAARASQLIGRELLALDLFIARKTKGTLHTAGTQVGIGHLPIEVISMIKDELYPVAIREITHKWIDEFLQYCEKGDWYDEERPSGALQFVREHIKLLEKLGKCFIRTSRDWYDWSWSFKDYQKAHSWWSSEDNDDNHHADHTQSALSEEWRLSELFLRRIGLEIMPEDGRAASRTIAGEKKEYGSIHEMFTPIYSRLAHPQRTGTWSDLLEDRNARPYNLVADLDMNALLRPPPSHKPYHFLLNKYQVEFLLPVDRSLGASQPRGLKRFTATGEERKKQEFLRRPNPRWMMWCEEGENRHED